MQQFCALPVLRAFSPTLVKWEMETIRCEDFVSLRKEGPIVDLDLMNHLLFIDSDLHSQFLEHLSSEEGL